MFLECLDTAQVGYSSSREQGCFKARFSVATKPRSRTGIACNGITSNTFAGDERSRTIRTRSDIVAVFTSAWSRYLYCWRRSRAKPSPLMTQKQLPPSSPARKLCLIHSRVPANVLAVLRLTDS